MRDMMRLRDVLSKRKKCLPLAAERGAVALRYRDFRSLLRHNHAALKVIADLEQLYFSGRPFSLTSIRIRYEELLEAVTGVIYSLESLSGRDYHALADVLSRIDGSLFQSFNPKCTITVRRPVVPFEEITQDMRSMVGAKAANLSSIRNELGLPVPPGFSITAYAFEEFLEKNRLVKPIKEDLSRISPDSPGNIERASERLVAMLLGAEMPDHLERDILSAYDEVEKKTGAGVRLAMRSSAIGEDTEATFAGQYDTVLNVRRTSIIEAYKQVVASKYSARAIAYRLHYGLDDRQTPMAVVGMAMVDSKASGVMYTVDPLLSPSCPIKINALWGVGEALVDGSASPDVFTVDRIDRRILDRRVSRKEARLVTLDRGGIVLDAVPEGQMEVPSIDDGTAGLLAQYGLLLEEYFEGAQDVEWAVDSAGNVFILQSRPLHLPQVRREARVRREYPGHPLVLESGSMASPGIATGEVFVVESERELNDVPRGAILVVRTASPQLARVAGAIRGLISDVGSVTSHMASVAREFGIPAIFNTGRATSILKTGDIVTIAADDVAVYGGEVDELVREMKPTKKLIFDSPLHKRMRDILDRIAPLTLTDPHAESFRAERCETFHDIVRFTHEQAMREMFGVSESAEKAEVSVKLTSSIPLNLRIVDLGGGLRDGLTTCDTITPDALASVPMGALWRGFTHPGVNWAGTMNIQTGGLSSLLAVTATSELGEAPGGDSYAVIADDYLNLNARFAYHFATLDALCTDNSSQNYVTLQFAGGGGNYYGRSLRVQVMANVLERLGFEVAVSGDLLDASLARFGREYTEDRLDLLGRLLASCRLVDMTLSSQEDVEIYTEAFFRGEYDFLSKRRGDELARFYLQGGHWLRVEEDGRVCCLQDGSKWGRRLSAGISGLMGKMIGSAYREFLDTMEAYYYFPVAIAKDLELADGAVSVRIKPVGGNIDRAGGLVFGMRNIDNYFVVRTNALEGNIILFEYINGKRHQRKVVPKRIETGVWQRLRIVLRDRTVSAYYNDDLVVHHLADVSLRGFVGLWTKADSVVYFDELTIEADGGRIVIPF